MPANEKLIENRYIHSKADKWYLRTLTERCPLHFNLKALLYNALIVYLMIMAEAGVCGYYFHRLRFHKTY